MSVYDDYECEKCGMSGKLDDCKKTISKDKKYEITYCPNCNKVVNVRSLISQLPGYKVPNGGEPARMDDRRKVKRAIERRLTEKGIENEKLVGELVDICMEYGRLKVEKILISKTAYKKERTKI